MKYFIALGLLILTSALGCQTVGPRASDADGVCDAEINRLLTRLSPPAVREFLETHDTQGRAEFYKAFVGAENFPWSGREKLARLLGEYDTEFYVWTLRGLPFEVDEYRTLAEAGLLSKGEEGARLLSKAYLDIFLEDPSRVQIAICYPSQWEDPGLFGNRRIMLLLHGYGLLQHMSPLYKQEFDKLIGFGIQVLNNRMMVKVLHLLHDRGVFAMKSGLAEMRMGMPVLPEVRMEISRVLLKNDKSSFIIKRAFDVGGKGKLVKVADQLIELLKSRGCLARYSTRGLSIEEDIELMAAEEFEENYPEATREEVLKRYREIYERFPGSDAAKRAKEHHDRVKREMKSKTEENSQEEKSEQ